MPPAGVLSSVQDVLQLGLLATVAAAVTAAAKAPLSMQPDKCKGKVACDPRLGCQTVMSQISGSQMQGLQVWSRRNGR
jgi:hypothetical protein